VPLFDSLGGIAPCAAISVLPLVYIFISPPQVGVLYLSLSFNINIPVCAVLSGCLPWLKVTARVIPLLSSTLIIFSVIHRARLALCSAGR
jgi:hypothetical protein